MSQYLRAVKTTSGRDGIADRDSSQRGSRDIEHPGSAHDGAELELLKLFGPAGSTSAVQATRACRPHTSG
jgi:hypothetical protein